MKAKLLVAFLAFFVSTAAFACPTAMYDPDAKFRWLAAGQFKSSGVFGVGGFGLKTFSHTTNKVNSYLVRHEIDLGKWVVRGRTRTDTLFNYTGRGTRGFVAATQTARSLFVPVTSSGR